MCGQIYKPPGGYCEKDEAVKGINIGGYGDVHEHHYCGNGDIGIGDVIGFWPVSKWKEEKVRERSLPESPEPEEAR